MFVGVITHCYQQLICVVVVDEKVSQLLLVSCYSTYYCYFRNEYTEQTIEDTPITVTEYITYGYCAVVILFTLFVISLYVM